MKACNERPAGIRVSQVLNTTNKWLGTTVKKDDPVKKAKMEIEGCHCLAAYELYPRIVIKSTVLCKVNKYVSDECVTKINILSHLSLKVTVWKQSCHSGP